MFRVAVVLLAALVLAMPARAQDAPQPTRIYVAYYQISYGDLEEWIGMYYEQSVPVLQALVDEGVITGFNARMHNDVANIPDGGDAAYVYDTMFQVNFADLEEWNSIWQELLAPVLDQAMTDGLLAGYVFESHNTGARFNWKALSLVNDWDRIDDLQAVFFGAVPLSHPLWKLFTAHRDEIWEALPPPN